MSLDTVLLARKRIVGCALETTTGTPIVLSGSDCGLYAFDPVFDSDETQEERERMGGFGTVQGTRGPGGGTAKFWTHLMGIGSGSGVHGLLFEGVGFVDAEGVYTASSAAQQTLTLGCYQDGRLKSVSGAMGNLIMRFKNGVAARCEWNFTGVWEDPASVALPSPTYPVLVPPRCVSSTITIGGTAFRFDELVLDMGNQVIRREDLAAASGYRSAWITNRKPRITIAPEALPLGSKDWFAAYRGSTEAAVSIAIGATAGNIITVSATKAQLAKQPGDTDRNGIKTDSLEFTVNDDNLVITMT